VDIEHEQRFRRIVAEYLDRPAGDYAELLHRGYVTSPPGADPSTGERRSARRPARTRSPDRANTPSAIRVMTLRDGDRAIAARRRVLSAEQERRELRDEFDRSELVR
jgi:hypothetical protein